MKKVKLLLVTLVLSAALSITSYAGTWQSSTAGWWYQNDDGSYPVNTWQWIDSDNNGIAENYYFDANGYCMLNTTTPDGRTVDENGAWIENGVIQTQNVDSSASTTPTETVPAASTTSSSSQSDNAGISDTPYDGYTIIVNTNTHKYHIPSCRSVKDILPHNLGYSSDASYLESNGYAACKRCH